MPEQPTLEERVNLLENRVTGLERARHIQEDRDIALLARIDDFIDDVRGVRDDVHRLERVQIHTLEVVDAGQAYLKERVDTIEGAGQAHQQAIEELTEGQQALAMGQQILAAQMATQTTQMTTLANQVTTLAEGQQILATQVATLEAGQQQILEILSGNPRRND